MIETDIQLRSTPSVSLMPGIEVKLNLVPASNAPGGELSYSVWKLCENIRRR